MIRPVENIERWVKHSPMSDPAGHIGRIAELPSDIRGLNCIIQGLLIHADWLQAYGLDAADYQAVSRETLPVADRLDAILARFPRLAKPQAAGAAGGGNLPGLRAYALRAFLRAKNIPAWVRCGFANILARLGRIIGFVNNIGTGKRANGV